MKGDVEMRYIGSKIEIIPYIDKLLNKHITESDTTFLDLFGGTNVVGEYFKKKFKIYSNDLLYFSYVNAKAIIENNEELFFLGLKNLGITSPLDYLQKEAENYISSSHVGYYEKSYSPTGNAMYLSVENAKRIDFIRDKIDTWREQNIITNNEFYYLLSVLIEAIPFVSNTTGTYGAFLKHWDKRAYKPLELVPLSVLNNHSENKCFNVDANELVKTLSVDIAYIDTPYNSRQYASNYHLLENIAVNNKPALKGVTKIFDWNKKKSNYCTKTHALEAMTDLIQNIDARHIIVSYNNEGIIAEEDLINLLKEESYNKSVDVVRIPYRKYKSKVQSKAENLYEILLYIQKKPYNKIREDLKENTTENISTWKCDKKAFIKSPLNYIGGKYRLLSQILPLFPDNINTFLDLFSGGANVGINVPANKHIFNDMNVRINEMFRYFNSITAAEAVEQVKRVIKENNLSKTNEEEYLDFRKKYNCSPNPLDLYVLSCYSYNYQFRFNNSMEFNNPFGRNRSHFSENMENNLVKFINKLHSINANFTDEYFENIDIEMLGENDFVYMDPPYLITTGSYNDGNRGFKDWGIEEEKELYQLMRILTKKNVRYALSNVIEHKGKTNTLLTNFVSEENVFVHKLDFSYNHSSHNTTRAGSIEVLITNYDPNTFEIIK